MVRQAKRERNYHVFYYLVKGADAEERARCFLQTKRCEDFYYLNQSGCTAIEGWNEEKLYTDLKVRARPHRCTWLGDARPDDAWRADSLSARTP